MDQVTPHRFTDEDQILAAIDSELAKAESFETIAGGLEIRIAVLRRDFEDQPPNTQKAWLIQEEIAKHRDRINHLRARAQKIRDGGGKMAYLKKKLAEFRTMTLPGIDIDRSIQQ